MKNVVNVLTLILKQMIYRFKCKQQTLKFELYLKEVKRFHDIEQFIAKKNKRLQYHNNKWSNYELTLQEQGQLEDMNSFVRGYIERL